MSETFGQRLRTRRRETTIPATLSKPEHAMTQEELAETLDISLSGLRHYERNRRLPHPIIKKSILRLWPDFFEYVSVAQQ